MIIIIINDFLPSYTLLHKWIPEITNRIPPYTITIRYGSVPCLISLQFKCVSKKSGQLIMKSVQIVRWKHVSKVSVVFAPFN